MLRPAVALSLILLVPAPDAQRNDKKLHPSYELGEHATVYPQPGDVVIEDFPVHTDTVGGSPQGLIDLRGAPGGYAGIWSDTRNGNLGLYVALLDENCEPLRPEEPVHPPVTARQLDPALALGPGLRGGVAWFFNQGQKGGIHARFFGKDEFTSTQPQPVGKVQRGAERVTGTRPAVAMTPEGGAMVARVEGGALQLYRFGDLGKRQPKGALPVQLSGEGAVVVGAPVLSISPLGDVLCAWSDADGINTWTRGADGTSTTNRLGPGEVKKVLGAGGTGWWLQTVVDREHQLLRLEADGSRRGEPLRPVAGPVTSMDIAGLLNGLAVLVVRPEVSAEGEDHGHLTEIHMLGPAGESLLEAPLDRLFGPDARDVKAPRIASLGTLADELLLAWNDERHGDPDVYYRRISTKATDTLPRRWNTDESSADQRAPSLASNGEQAVVAWEDTRHGGRPQVFLRLVGAQGPFPPQDVQTGFQQDGDRTEAPGATLPESRRPAVAVAKNGEFLVAWKMRVEADFELVGQIFHSWGAPKSDLLRLDPGQATTVMWASAVTALEHNRGYLLSWIRKDTGPMVLWLKPDGTSVNEPVPIAARTEQRAARPAITEVEGGRAFVAWDQPVGEGRPAIIGRFIGKDGAPQGEPILIPPTTLGEGDLDAALAPGPNGGFVLAWTGNESPGRDALARVFDFRGQPVSPILWVSVKHNEQDYADITRLKDGTWAISWEEDLSGQDHVCVRRLSPEGGWTLGTRVTLNQRDTPFNEARTAGQVAPLGDGLVGIWGDRRRAQGSDIYARVLGPLFDEPK